MLTLPNITQKIDYSGIVTIDKLDRATYENKFKLLAQAKAEDNMELYSYLLTDDTLFAHEFFFDDSGNPFTYEIYQDAIANLHHDFTPMNENRFILFIGSNQIGKSCVLINKAVHLVTTGNNINILMVSRSLPQSQFLLASIKHSLNNSRLTNWREDLGDTANTTILTFQRDNNRVTNRIICAPCGEGLLGYPAHYLFLDELDFYENAKEFFFGVALPRTNHTKGQIMVFSNPNYHISRNSSILWQLLNGDLFKRKFMFKFLDNSRNTIEEYNRLKQEIPSIEFQSTHDGQFPVDAGSFFKQSELDRNIIRSWENCLPIVDSPVYIGLDLGKINDNSVLTLGTVKEIDGLPYLEVKYIEVFELRTDYRDVAARLKVIYDYYTKTYQGVGNIGLDTTGVGRAVEEFLQENQTPYTSVTWTHEIKTKMYGDFKLLMENNRIKIVYTTECYKQLSSLTFKTTPSGLLTFENNKEKDHDDIPSSLCLLINVAIKPNFVVPSISLLR